MDITDLVQKAKDTMELLTTLLKKRYKKSSHNKLEIGNDAFYESVTPYIHDENSNVNINSEPRYRISFTNNKSIIIPAKVYESEDIYNAVQDLKYYTEKILEEEEAMNLEIIQTRNEDLDKIFKNASTPAAGGRSRSKKRKSKRCKSKKSKSKSRKSKRCKSKK